MGDLLFSSPPSAVGNCRGLNISLVLQKVVYKHLLFKLQTNIPFPLLSFTLFNQLLLFFNGNEIIGLLGFQYNPCEPVVVCSCWFGFRLIVKTVLETRTCFLILHGDISPSVRLGMTAYL